LNEIKELSNVETPDVEIDNLNFYYSDSAYVRFRMIAPKVIIKSKDKVELIREFPESITLYSFNKKGEKTTELVADFAIHYIDSNLWLAKENVICLTNKGLKLTTEKVYWDMEKKNFYTDVPLMIVDKKNIIYGQGLLADENFNYIRIQKSTGKILAPKDEVIRND